MCNKFGKYAVFVYFFYTCCLIGTFWLDEWEYHRNINSIAWKTMQKRLTKGGGGGLKEKKKLGKKFFKKEKPKIFFGFLYLLSPSPPPPRLR